MDSSKREIALIDPETGSPVSPDQCSNYMNSFLTSAGPKLANALPHTPFHSTFDEFKSKLRFKRITVEETIKQVENMNIEKSSALDGLSSRLIKDAFLCLLIHLAYIFNLSIDNAVFPESWKQSNFVLIPMDGLKSYPNNYRPISLLPLPGKLLEKLIHACLCEYLLENDIPTERQGGFRPGYSTTLTASLFTMDVLQAHLQGKITAAIFVDLHKAFDTIDHSILLSKLRAYGVCNLAHKWFDSYISNGQQNTIVNGIFSDYAKFSHGVPQGSVLGPVLFLIYINDLTKVIAPNMLHLYAADTVLYVSGTKSGAVFAQMQLNLNLLVNWCTMNKLTLNAKKTKSLIFFKSKKNPSQ